MADGMKINKEPKGRHIMSEQEQQGERELGKNQRFIVRHKDGGYLSESASFHRSDTELLCRNLGGSPEFSVVRVTLIESSQLAAMREREEKCREALQCAYETFGEIGHLSHPSVKEFDAMFHEIIGEAGR